MPKISGRQMWCAEVDLVIHRIALSAQYIEKGKGSTIKRFLVATDWLDTDKRTVMFDVGKRLKGWLKEQVMTMKPSLRDRIQYGVICKSLPETGFNPIATIDDFMPSRNWESFKGYDQYDLNGLPAPNVECIQTQKGMSIFAMHYVIKKDVEVKARIYCFAQIPVSAMESWLKTLGQVKGLGDKHNSSEGYGCFDVKDFHQVSELELNF